MKRLQFYALLMQIPDLRCLEVDVTAWVPQPTLVPNAVRALAGELRLYVPSVVSVVFVNEFERTVVRVVRGVGMVKVDVDTGVLWREV
jgi:hypothetical protein